jgi:hypothetical protein
VISSNKLANQRKTRKKMDEAEKRKKEGTSIMND